MKFCFAVALALCVIMLACTYDPKSEYINPIEPASLENFDISLNDIPNGDTIELFGSGTFSYTATTGKGVIDRVRITMGDQYVTESNTATGTFSLANYLRTGVWELKIDVITSSGSGSLAEKLQAEQVEVWRKWIVKIDVAPPPQPDLRLSEENGYQVLRWDAYQKKNFVRYQLRVTSAGDPERIIYFDDPAVTSWVDSSYMGVSDIQYEFYVFNVVSSAGDVASAKGTFGFNMKFNPADSMATLTLRPPKFYSAFDRYEIEENQEKRLVITDAKQPTVVMKLNTVGYKTTSDIGLKIYSKDPKQAYKSYSLQVADMVLPKRLGNPYRFYHYNADRNVMIGIGHNGSPVWRLVFFDPVTLVASDSIENDSYSYAVPFRGDYVYFTRPPSDLVQVNFITHAEKSFPGIQSSLDSGPFSISPANNQIVKFSWSHMTPSSQQYYENKIYDIANDKTLYLKSYSNISDILSPDGAYFRSGKLMYSLALNDYVGSLPDANTFIAFREDRPDEVLSYVGALVFVHDRSNLSVKRTLTAPAGSRFEYYDTAKKKILFTNPFTKMIYAADLDTGEVIPYRVNLADFVVLNGILFTPEGYILRLY
ncbi:hypothetical protein SAMN04488109_1857 [Chryseolinea serpens]|uniref:Fibronectin type-III domain-containing protein n=1 Tax=Chryseolinea serpens TaxID=947013 RepID=A0A1M5MP66_9BACT|nr:hypothetical protein [Chryseolinea serpens]SHG79190.1 hypothetical protein SAMN04488109_1857 [Chryseolinea serpens]